MYREGIGNESQNISAVPLLLLSPVHKKQLTVYKKKENAEGNNCT